MLTPLISHFHNSHASTLAWGGGRTNSMDFIEAFSRSRISNLQVNNYSGREKSCRSFRLGEVPTVPPEATSVQ